MATKNNPEDYDPDVDAHNDVSPQSDDVHDDHDTRPPAEVLTTTKARRLFKALHKSVKDAMEQLQSLKVGQTVELTTLATEAMICGTLDLKYPLDDSDLDALEMLRDQARDGQFNDHIDLALDVLEDILTTVEIARSAVTVMSVLDEPMSQNWSNLPTIVLARCVNQRGHELMRGRLPGANL